MPGAEEPSSVNTITGENGCGMKETPPAGDGSLITFVVCETLIEDTTAG
jgi:hypothetical protein